LLSVFIGKGRPKKARSSDMKTGKTVFAIVIISLLLLVSGNLPAEQMRFAESLLGDRILLPVSVPDHGQLTMLALSTIMPESDVIVTLALYDDPRTKRYVDYLELYDIEGGLLAISWIDRFGVVRTAIDRALLEEEASELEGVLVIVPDGTPA
jgi:hypothetical protein